MQCIRTYNRILILSISLLLLIEDFCIPFIYHIYIDEATLEKLLQQKKEAANQNGSKTHTGGQKADTINSSGRHYTVSVALPGSIVDNAQSPELRTYLAGQIGRALAVFNVDEVVIFREVIKQEGKQCK